MNLMDFVHLAIPDSKSLALEDVVKLKLRKEIPIAKFSMLTIFVLNAQKELSSIHLESVLQLILHVLTTIELMDFVPHAMLATNFLLVEVVFKPKLLKVIPTVKHSITMCVLSVQKEQSSIL